MRRKERQIKEIEDLEVWIRPREDGSNAVGVFNRGEKPGKVTAFWTDLNISGMQRIRDLWRQKDLGRFESKFSASEARDGVVMVRMWPLTEK